MRRTVLAAVVAMAWLRAMWSFATSAQIIDATPLPEVVLRPEDDVHHSMRE